MLLVSFQPPLLLLALVRYLANVCSWHLTASLSLAVNLPPPLHSYHIAFASWLTLLVPDQNTSTDSHLTVRDIEIFDTALTYA